MIDIITNPAQRSITTDTHFKYYLVVVDVASRLFVPKGIQYKKPKTIFKAIQDWTMTFGPSELYNLSHLERVHRDFDASFRSHEVNLLAVRMRQSPRGLVLDEISCTVPMVRMSLSNPVSP
jgi:hypothetical protein